jgi:hypothetical protein
MPAMKLRKKDKKADAAAAAAAGEGKEEKKKFNPGPFNMKPPIPHLCVSHKDNGGRRGTTGMPCEFCGAGADDTEKVAAWYCLECDDFLCGDCDTNKHEFAKYASHKRHRFLDEDRAAVRIQAEWRMKAAMLLTGRLLLIVRVQRGATAFQCLYRCRVARAALRAAITAGYEYTFDLAHQRHFYFNKSTGSSSWAHPPGLYYRPHWRCDHKRHHHPLCRLELRPTMDVHQAAIVLQGLQRKRAARAVYRAKLHAVWEKVFDEASNEYVFVRSLAMTDDGCSTLLLLLLLLTRLTTRSPPIPLLVRKQHTHTPGTTTSTAARTARAPPGTSRSPTSTARRRASSATCACGPSTTGVSRAGRRRAAWRRSSRASACPTAPSTCSGTSLSTVPYASHFSLFYLVSH